MYLREMETGSKERDRGGGGEGKSLAYERGSVRGERFCVIINRIVSTCTGNVDILNADRTTSKLTLQDINTTPKELKTERDCSHRQLFRPLWGPSVWPNNQRPGSDEKLSAHSDFSPDPELLTPTESRHTTCLLGGKSPSVKLMSRRENKGLAKTNL